MRAPPANAAAHNKIQSLDRGGFAALDAPSRWLYSRMIEVETVDALSTFKLLQSIAALYRMLALVHVVLDYARYRHPPDHSPGGRVQCPPGSPV